MNSGPSILTEIRKDVHPQNPVLLENLMHRLRHAGLLLASKAMLGLVAEKGSAKADELHEQCIKLEQAINAMDAALTREQVMPKVHLRIFQKTPTDKASFGVLFPAKIGNADLRTIFESWGFKWEADVADHFGAPDEGKWSADHVHVYRNAKHSLVVKTFHKIPEQATTS